MAHFAKVNEKNQVTEVLVVDNSHEERGAEFLAEDCKLGGVWIQTSYNNKIRGKFAAVGDTYDSTLDRFIAPQPFASWTLDADFNWQPPTACPNDGKVYSWDEKKKIWIEVV
jgi:hypothetical protein